MSTDGLLLCPYCHAKAGILFVYGQFALFNPAPREPRAPVVLRHVRPGRPRWSLPDAQCTACGQTWRMDRQGDARAGR